MFETNVIMVHEEHANDGVFRTPATFEQDVAHMDPRDPIRDDEIVDLAAAAAKRAAPGPLKQYARAADISISRASRHLNGADPYSPMARMFALIDALTRSEYTTAIPLINEQIRIVMAALIDLPDHELDRRLTQLQNARFDLDHELRAAERDLHLAHDAQHKAWAKIDEVRAKLIEADLGIQAIRTVQSERAERGR